MCPYRTAGGGREERKARVVGSLGSRKLKLIHLRAAEIEDVEVKREREKVGLEQRGVRSCQVKQKVGEPAQGGIQQDRVLSFSHA